MTVSLHTKYRPSTFEEVVGQDGVVSSLKDVLAKGLSRSFLFTGESGTGKTTLARIIANHVGCESHNITEVDAATYNGIDAMREITETLPFRPLGRSPNRMIIVDECHAISKAAWQSLLKAIEEPPPHVYWAFCTTEPGKVPTTIKTRCTSYQLRPLTERDLMGLVTTVAELEGFPVTEEVVELIAQEARGSARQALVYLEQCAAVTNAKTAAQLIQAVGESDAVIELCRWLAKGNGLNWSKATKMIKNLEGENPESVRLKVVNYLTKCALGANSDKEACRYLQMVETFQGTYFGSEGTAPIVLAVGRIIFGEDG